MRYWYVAMLCDSFVLPSRALHFVGKQRRVRLLGRCEPIINDDPFW